MSYKIDKKILVTFAGTTVAQNVIEYNKDNFKDIYAVDSSSFCYSAKVLKDNFFVVPPLKNWNDYKEALLKICRKENINLIIPCSNDEEIVKLSRHRDEFKEAGTDILLSNYEVIMLCDDKVKCNSFVSNLGIKVPRMYQKNEVARAKFPIFFKSRRGNGSEYAKVIYRKEELNDLSVKDNKFILQEFIKGPEYSIDLVLNNDSDLVAGACRKRVSVKSGLCVKAEISRDNSLIEKAGTIARSLKLIGPVNIQFIKDYFIEANPRLPGGLGLDAIAGFNLALLGVKAFYNLPIKKEETKLKEAKVLRIWRDILYERK